jgi:hypothetical protein
MSEIDHVAAGMDVGRKAVVAVAEVAARKVGECKDAEVSIAELAGLLGKAAVIAEKLSRVSTWSIFTGIKDSLDTAEEAYAQTLNESAVLDGLIAGIDGARQEAEEAITNHKRGGIKSLANHLWLMQDKIGALAGTYDDAAGHYAASAAHAAEVIRLDTAYRDQHGIGAA